MVHKEAITSLQNPRIKSAVRLRDRRHRDEQGRILIDGARELGLALEAGVELVEVFVCEQLLHSEWARQVVAKLRAGGVTLLSVAPGVFEKLAFGERAEGVLGIARTPHRELADLRLPESPLVAVLEGVEKPGNVGAVLRSADAAGVAALVAAAGRTDLYNPNCIRASLGAVFTLPVCSAGTDETIAWLRQQGLRIYAARLDAAALYTEVSYVGPTAIVLGSEAAGLSDAWSAPDMIGIKLPLRGKADSLNVSVTAAVLFYEALRQREQGG